MKIDRPERVEELLSFASGAPIDRDTSLRIVSAAGLFEGHFRLQSGLHSSVFLRVSQLAFRPDDAEFWAERMAALVKKRPAPTVCLAAGNGGRALATALAAKLGVRLAASKVDGRRKPLGVLEGEQTIGAKDRVLLVSDMITTGGSLKTLEAIVRAHEAKPVGVLALCASREVSGERADLSSLFVAQWTAVEAKDCPQCAARASLWPAYDLA